MVEQIVLMFLMSMCLTASPAQSTRTVTPAPASAAGRVVHFPAERSLGELHAQVPGSVTNPDSWFGRSPWDRGDYVGQAQGDVRVPSDQQLTLTVDLHTQADLAALSRLRPDDLYGVLFPPGPQGSATDVSDAVMPHIAHLTGLRFLTLSFTSVTDAGMKYVAGLKSLEYLGTPPQVTDEGMVYVGQLASLRYLALYGAGQVTDAGLQNLRRLTALEELSLVGDRMSDAGLAHLSGLTRLEYLYLSGSHFGDLGMAHLKGLPSLKRLLFDEGQPFISDAGLADIAEIPNLERLALRAKGDVTDSGVAHLVRLRSLKWLAIPNAHVTDAGLAHLSQIKTLERLDLPGDQNRITDKGISCLAQLPKIRELNIGRIYYVDPNGNKEYYTDKCLKVLSQCQNLEKLSVGSPGITDAGLGYVAKLGKLRTLTVFGCDHITDAGVAKLSALGSLESLNISYGSFTIAGLNSLKPMPHLTFLGAHGFKRGDAVLDLSALTSLEGLQMRMEPFTEKFLDADLKGLAGLKHLRDLQISPRDFSDSGIAYLSGLTNLDRLHIGGSRMTDEGLKHLSGMKNLSSLQICSGYNRGKPVSGGNITDKGLGYVEGFKRLGFLEIYSDSDLSDAALRHLQRSLSDLHHLKVNGSVLSLDASPIPATPAQVSPASSSRR